MDPEPQSPLATKEDLLALREDVLALRAELHKELRIQYQWIFVAVAPIYGLLVWIALNLGAIQGHVAALQANVAALQATVQALVAHK
jgi:hypothetical protein